MIEFDHVTKLFRRGPQATLRHSLGLALERLRGRGVPPAPPLKALDDVSLSIGDGEVVGLVGHNGAGKTTLLKLISRISEPTQGTVRVRGRVAPLIALGSAMVPDFTGRENLILNATLLGMARRDILARFDEIVAFAELEDFIDTPLKRYSSGMQARLGFAVATAVPAEILLVDEVLAVGDLAFQRKCFARMADLMRAGRTVVIVGHDVRQIAGLCPRMVWLDHGRVLLDADSGTVCNHYFRQAVEREHANPAPSGPLRSALADAGITVRTLAIGTGADGLPTTRVAAGDPLFIRVEVELREAMPALSVEIGVHTTDQLTVLRAGTAMLGVQPALPAGRHVIDCRFERLPLNPDPYSVSLTFRDRHGLVLWQTAEPQPFQVVPGALDATRLPAQKALLYLPFDWRIPSIGLNVDRCDPLSAQGESA